MNWEKQRNIYERKAYRIVQNHISKILKNIPYNNVTLSNYEILIKSNISEEQIFKMFREIYTTIGINYGDKVKSTLEKAKIELDYDFSECNLVKSTFLVINAVYPNINDDGKELGTYICTNGQEITTPLAYEEVLKIVMDLPELESEQANEDGYNDAMNLVTHAIRKFIKDAK